MKFCIQCMRVNSWLVRETWRLLFSCFYFTKVLVGPRNISSDHWYPMFLNSLLCLWISKPGWTYNRLYFFVTCFQQNHVWFRDLASNSILQDSIFNNRIDRRANQCTFKRSFCKCSLTETTHECALICLPACFPFKWGIL